MPYVVKQLPNEPILLMTVSSPFDMEKDAPPLFALAAKTAEPIPGHVYCVYDLRKLELSFGDLVLGLSAQTGHVAGSMSDPNITAVMIGSSEMLKLAEKAFQQKQYGEIGIKLFGSVEDATNYVRNLSKQAKV